MSEEQSQDRQLDQLSKPLERLKKLRERNQPADPEDEDPIDKYYRQTFATAEGKKVLRHLAQELGYQLTSVVVNPQNGQVNTDGLLFNEVRRSVYLEIRQRLTKDILMEVEYE